MNFVEERRRRRIVARMFFLRFLPLLVLAFSLSGCMFVPLFDDYDASKVDEDMTKLENKRNERLQQNRNISPAEYNAMAGPQSALPPKPTTAELEKAVNEGK